MLLYSRCNVNGTRFKGQAMSSDAPQTTNEVAQVGPDHKPDPNKRRRFRISSYKSRMQIKVFVAIATCVVFFVFLFTPKEVGDPLVERISEAYASFVKLGLSLPIMFILQWILFAQDHLANGNSLPSTFFRHYYPSSFAKHKYDLSAPTSNRLWFDLYNQWHDPDHSYHEKYKINSKRTYSLRLIYYLYWISVIFLVTALATAVLCFYPLKEADFSRLLPARIAVIVFIGLFAFLLRQSNRLSYNKDLNYYERYQATGAYHKYKEYQGILWEIFEEEVLIPRKANKTNRIK